MPAEVACRGFAPSALLRACKVTVLVATVPALINPIDAVSHGTFEVTNLLRVARLVVCPKPSQPIPESALCRLPAIRKNPETINSRPVDTTLPDNLFPPSRE